MDPKSITTGNPTSNPGPPQGQDWIPIDEFKRLRAYANKLEKYQEELEQKLSAYSSMQEVGSAVETTPEIEETLQKLVAKISMIMQAEKCVIMLLDETEKELIAQRPALGIPDRELRLMRAKISEGVSGEVFMQNRPLMIPDAAHDSRWDQNMVYMLQVINSLTVPLSVLKEGEEIPRPIGVLHVMNKKRRQPFTEEDARLLSTLARQASAIIQNARTFMTLVEKTTQLESTLEHMQTGVVVLDEEGRVLFCNPVARKIIGSPIDADLRHMDMNQAVKNTRIREIMLTSLRQHKPVNDEVTLLMPDELTFQMQAVAGGENNSEVGEVGVVATFTDITSIRKLERLKTEFVSTVSHELRTPLTSIKGFISTLLGDTEEEFDLETRMEFYQIIDEECDRLTRLISDLLTISRIEAGRSLDLKIAPLELPALLNKTINTIRSSTDIHEFALDIASEIPIIHADRDKVDQVVTNLLSNAVKYSPNGGIITVGATASDNEVTVSVSDQGIGIPDDQLDKVFDRFHRVDSSDARQAEGVGLGLFLVKHLVEAHGGRIWVESVYSKGSTFSFKLPLQPVLDAKKKQEHTID